MFRRPSLTPHRTSVRTFFGELALIVIGVLLALSVDEWRQSRARAIAAEHAIDDIRAELESNRQLAIESREYHQSRLAHISTALRSGDALQPAEFPQGFTAPARFLSAAWDTARESGDLASVDRDLRRRIAVAYSWQSRYEKQIDAVSALIYGTLFAAGPDGMVENPKGLMMLLATFSYREAEIVEVFDEALAAIDAR